jgi:sulfatase modifying factor 1
VSRGGSHSTEVYYLRSGNRAANLPGQRTWLTGFRLVATPKLLSVVDPQIVATVTPRSAPSHALATIAGWNTNGSALFLGPLQYVNIKNGSTGPLWSKHNHDPALAVVPGSGDVVAVWFTTYVEPGREAALAIATLKAGELDWGPVRSLYDPPDRCMCCPAMFADEVSISTHFRCGSV